jgi:hypothetical protein
MLLRAKEIDTAVIEFDTDRATLDFCKEAHARCVPLVYLTGYVATRARAAH